MLIVERQSLNVILLYSFNHDFELRDVELLVAIEVIDLEGPG